jgi:tRNA(Ile)-lysidine synthase
MTTLLERFRDFVEGRELLRPGATVVVGYSGGADSGALLELLVAYGARAIAAHLNHGLRPLAHWDEELARSVAVRLGVPFVSERVDVHAMAEQKRISIEEAGRAARYDFLARVAAQFGASAVATAHTLDDHVETALLHLARGSGARGLTGIPERRGDVVRPLLFARRWETRAHCLRQGIAWIEDPSNWDESHTRARARRRLLPAFESLHGEAVANASRAMEILREEDRTLEAAAAEWLERAAIQPADALGPLFAGVYERYRVDLLLSAPLAIRRRAVVQLIRRFGASPRYDLVEAVLAALEGREAAAVNPSSHVSLFRKGGCLIVKRADAPERFCVKWHGSGAVQGRGWVVKRSDRAGEGAGPLECLLRSDALAQGVWIRLLSPDDRLELGGRSINPWRALKKCGVPMVVRGRLPVIADALGLVWVATFGVADRAAARAEADGVRVCLELKGEASEGILGG